MFRCFSSMGKTSMCERLSAPSLQRSTLAQVLSASTGANACSPFRLAYSTSSIIMSFSPGMPTTRFTRGSALMEPSGRYLSMLTAVKVTMETSCERYFLRLTFWFSG